MQHPVLKPSSFSLVLIMHTVDVLSKQIFRRVRKIAKSDYQLHVRPSVRLSVCPSARNNSAIAERILMQFHI